MISIFEHEQTAHSSVKHRYATTLIFGNFLQLKKSTLPRKDFGRISTSDPLFMVSTPHHKAKTPYTVSTSPSDYASRGFLGSASYLN